MTPKLDLDTSNLIDLEQAGCYAADIRSLRSLHEDGRVELRLIGASASESQRDGSALSNFADFMAWVGRLGLGDLEILKPIGVYDVTYYDWCVYGDGDGPLSRLEEAIGGTLFLGAWENGPVPRNKLCDVLMMWSHIHYRGDAFVTRNSEDFLRASRPEALKALGAGELLTPAEAVARYS